MLLNHTKRTKTLPLNSTMKIHLLDASMFPPDKFWFPCTLMTPLMWKNDPIIPQIRYQILYIFAPKNPLLI